MKYIQYNGLRPLSIKENFQINGGEAAEGSYSLGYKIGSSIRNVWILFWTHDTMGAEMCC